MNERDLAHRIKHYLNLGADDVDSATAGRLFAARQAALARHQVAEGRLGLAGSGHGFHVRLPNLRAVAALIVLVAGVLGASVWKDYRHYQQAAEDAEIDSALLADDLPINAYLDRGFQAWLEQRSSRQ